MQQLGNRLICGSCWLTGWLACLLGVEKTRTMAFYEFFFSSVSIYLCYTRLFLVRILIDCLDIGLHGRTDGPSERTNGDYTVALARWTGPVRLDVCLCAAACFWRAILRGVAWCTVSASGPSPGTCLLLCFHIMILCRVCLKILHFA